MNGNKYPPELKRRLVELGQQGVPARQLALKYEPSATPILTWLREAEKDPVERQAEQDLAAENRRLRRENKRQKETIAILEKATAWTSYVMSSPISSQ